MTAMNRRDYGWITDEIRETAVEAVVEAMEGGLSVHAACVRIAESFELHTNTVKNWVLAAGKVETVRAKTGREVVELMAERDALRKALATLKRQKRS